MKQCLSNPLHCASGSRRSAQAQRGISMIVSLITLIAMALAAVAMVRSTDTSTAILGNLAFKQDTQRAADQATNTAVAWLVSQIANTDVMNGVTPTTGYYSLDPGVIDATGNGTTGTRINWNNDTCGGYTGTCLTPSAQVSLDTPLPTWGKTGVTAQYVVIRLCDAADPDATGTQCARPAFVSAQQGNERNQITGESATRLDAGISAQYFRVIVRTLGGRKAVTYTETIVHF